VNQHF